MSLDNLPQSGIEMEPQPHDFGETIEQAVQERTTDPANLDRAHQKISRNVVVTIIARVGYLLTRIAIPPFVLTRIGLGAYGLWSTAFVLVMYLGISTQGISNVYIKYIAQYTAQREYKRANALLSTGLSFTIPLCSALFAMMWFFWPTVARWIKLPANLASDGKEAVLVLFAVFLCSLSLNAFTDVLSGVQEIAAAQWFWTISFLVETALIFILLSRGRGLRGMAEAFAVRTVVNIGLSVWWSYRKLKWLHVSPRLCSRDAFRHVLHFGGITQLQALFANLIASVERMLGSSLMGVEAAGIFDLAKKWPASVSTVPMSFFNAFMPAASHLFSHKNIAERMESVRQLYLRGARYSNLASGYFCGLMAMLPAAIISVWIGPAKLTAPGQGVYSIAYVVPLFALFSVSSQIHMLTGPGTSILRGIGRIYDEFYYAVPNIFLLAVTVPLSHLILHQWTVLGIGISVCISTLIAAIIMLVRAHIVLHIPTGIYLRDVIWPGLVPYLVGAFYSWPVTTVVAYFIATHKGNPGRWMGAAVLILSGAVYTLVLGIVLDRLVLCQNERQRWRSTLQRLIRAARRQYAASV